MENYITTITEQDKISKFIASQDANKGLSILYAKGNDQISLSLVSEIKNAKGSVDFVEFDNVEGQQEVYKAFTIGKLIGKYGELIPITSDTLINQLCGGKKASAPKKQYKPREKKITESVATTPSVSPASTVTEQKTKPQTAPNPKRDKNDDEFDHFLKSIKTKEFDAYNYKMKIMMACNQIINEGANFEDALKYHFKDMGDKAIAVLNPHRTKLMEIMNRMEKE